MTAYYHTTCDDEVSLFVGGPESAETVIALCAHCGRIDTSEVYEVEEAS
jgi:hypothetical protein